MIFQFTSTSAEFSSRFGFIPRSSAQLRHTLIQVCVLFLLSFGSRLYWKLRSDCRPFFLLTFKFAAYASFPWKLNRYSYGVQFVINCTALDQSKLSNFVECTINRITWLLVIKWFSMEYYTLRPVRLTVFRNRNTWNRS